MNSQDRLFINLALTAAGAGTCLRRKYGAVLVKNGVVLSIGYNGAPSQELKCTETGDCARNILREKKGEVYEVCRGLHAEMMAVINAGSERARGATLYVAAIDTQTGKLFEAKPCDLCARIIKEVGIGRVVCHPGIVGAPLIEYAEDNQ